jgi:hypothetical protein
MTPRPGLRDRPRTRRSSAMPGPGTPVSRRSNGGQPKRTIWWSCVCNGWTQTRRTGGSDRPPAAITGAGIVCLSSVGPCRPLSVAGDRIPTGLFLSAWSTSRWRRVVGPGREHSHDRSHEEVAAAAASTTRVARGRQGFGRAGRRDQSEAPERRRAARGRAQGCAGSSWRGLLDDGAIRRQQLGGRGRPPSSRRS